MTTYQAHAPECSTNWATGGQGLEFLGCNCGAAAATENKGRRPLDFYETPPWQTEALISRIPISGRVFEPCVGDGAIANILKARATFYALSYPTVPVAVRTNDVDPDRPADYHDDARDPAAWSRWREGGVIDWTVSNTPFDNMLPFVVNAVGHSRIGVALLARISFLEPTRERGEWLSVHPPDAQIWLPRWSYKANGKSDSATTSWLVWFNDAVLRAKFAGIYIHKDKPVTARRRKGRRAKNTQKDPSA